MAHLYFTRHGQTIWNVENKICGATDIALTTLGREQARALGQQILAEHLLIDEILYSPLIRARVSQITGLPAREEIRLTEQNFGKYESTPRDGTEFQEAKKSFIYHFGHGETMLHLAQRIYNLLDELRTQEKTYLLVAHNGIARVVHSYFYDMGNEEYAAFGIQNCEIREYQFGTE